MMAAPCCRLVADSEDGPMAVNAGVIVSLAAKPIQYGRILYFGVDKVRRALKH